MKKEDFIKFIKEIGKHSVTVIIVVSAFFIGVLFERWKSSSDLPEKESQKIVERRDVSLAIDENDNLLMIDNGTGDYIIYKDSIGNAIFKLYAKNIWAQHKIE